MQRKYMTLRVKITLNENFASAYHRGDWAVPFGDFMVRWFPSSWSLQERKERERFQAAIYNIPDSMTAASLITNGTANSFLTNAGVRSFKIIQLPDKSRKLVGFFEIWSAVQQVKYRTHP